MCIRDRVVINNTDQTRHTAVLLPEGEVSLTLAPFATCILDR